MPSSPSGARPLEDEKQLLTELGRLFHTVKAQWKERTNARRAAAASTAATAPSAGKKKQKTAARKPPRKSRRSAHGGSVWIVMKGGFATSTVPASPNRQRVSKKCFARGAIAERGRLGALEAAEAYVASAWAAAEEAGIGSSSTRTTSCPEGDAYMREQFTVALQMLDQAVARAPGTHIRALVDATSTAAAGSSGSAVCVPDKATVDANKSHEVDWEDVAARELAIRQSPFAHVNHHTELAEEAFKATVADAGRSYYYELAEPASTDAAGDIASTKCIVRIRNSQKQKHTAVLSSQKAVNYFRSNFGQVLRKELANSKLPRGAVTEAVSGEAGSQAHQVQPHPQQQQHLHGGGKGKRRGKR